MLEFAYSGHFDLSAAEEIVRTCLLIQQHSGLITNSGLAGPVIWK
jgi:hypothetical protein